MSIFPKKFHVTRLFLAAILAVMMNAACDIGPAGGSMQRSAVDPTPHRASLSVADAAIVIVGSVPAGAAAIDDVRVAQIVGDEFLAAEPGRYSRVTVQVQFDGADQPARLKVYLLCRDSYRLDEARVLMDEGYAAMRVDRGDEFAASDAAWDSINPSYAISQAVVARCPDERVQFVFSTALTEYPAITNHVTRSYDAAVSKGYSAVKLLGPAENVAAMKNWLACRNLVAWGRIGHGSASSIMLDDGALNATYFNYLPTTALNSKVLFFNSCKTHNPPLQPAVVHAGTQKFIGGISDLTIGKSERVFGCFWQKVILEGTAISAALSSCKATYSPYTNDYGISGSGADYLGVQAR